MKSGPMSRALVRRTIFSPIQIYLVRLMCIHVLTCGSRQGTLTDASDMEQSTVELQLLCPSQDYENELLES